MNSFDSFTHSQESDDVVVPYVQDSDKSVEELSKTFQGLSSPSKEDQSVDLPVPRRWASVNSAFWDCFMTLQLLAWTFS